MQGHAHVIVSLFASIACGACSSTGVERQAQSKPTEWAVHCHGVLKNRYGEVTNQPMCFVIASSLESGWENGRQMSANSIFKVDSTGPRFVNEFSYDRYCRSRPTKIAVDGVRIDHLSTAEQLSRVRAGSRLVRQHGTPWPNCYLQDETMSLVGAETAFNEMLSRWQELKR